MFKKFRDAFIPCTAIVSASNISDVATADTLLPQPSLIAFRKELGGLSFCHGLYRIISASDVSVYSERIAATFPEHNEDMIPIAYDWLNRIFCLDISRVVDGEYQIFVVSAFSDGVFEIPSNLNKFHNDDLVRHRDAILESNLFEIFLKKNGITELNSNSCASLKIPLFLNGDYEVENMELCDCEVDFSITSQLLQQTRGLKNGQRIDIIAIAPEVNG